MSRYTFYNKTIHKNIELNVKKLKQSIDFHSFLDT